MGRGLTRDRADDLGVPLISVVIPSVNGAAHLRLVLGSLRPPSAGPLEVVVVDGGSTDGSRAACADAPIPVRFLSTGHNLGYAAAANAGLRAARGRFLLVLNNDTVAAPDLLDRLVQAAEDSGAALVVPRVLTLTGEGRIDNTGHRLYRDGLNLCRGRGKPADDERGRVPIPPLLPSGAALLLRRDALARLGGFDEEFFAYGEDAELGLRSLRAGLAIHYAPDAVVRHLGGGTWGAASVRKAFLVERNRARLAVAHLPWAQLAASPWHWLARYAEHARARDEGPLGAYPGRWQQGVAAIGAAAAVTASLAGLPGDLRRRARARAQATLSDEQLESLLRRSMVGRRALRTRKHW